ncbi:MAG: MFS transporter [Pseudomonadota bacterium]|nr:MFS transporter [Pseudomonadota bacterium]
MTAISPTEDVSAFDGAPAWRRLAIALALSTCSGIGLWSIVVSLPYIEAAFGADRGGASLPYTATMLGFAAGGVLMGRLADRYGTRMPLMAGGVLLALGYGVAALSQSIWQLSLVQGLLIGLGASGGFGPLVADISLWFRRRRGIAVAIIASGNYLAGTVWPPILQAAIEAHGWRIAFAGLGVMVICTVVPLALALRARPPAELAADVAAQEAGRAAAMMSKGTLQALLLLAGLSCCVAMSMPQVHIVAYCADLGFGPARGAEMLSLMLGFGVLSRLVFGVIADRVGGVRTLILSSTLQCLALAFYLPFDGLTSLYVVSAMFGLAQGGIVPSYALIVRQYYPAAEAGTRIGAVLMMTILGMALGGWMSGEIYDYTGSYAAAFVNGIAFNLVNMSVAAWLLLGPRLATPRTA